MKYDTAGNPIYELVSGCDCNSTSGCEKCRIRQWENKIFGAKMKILCDYCKREYEVEKEPEKWQEAICPNCKKDMELED